jgi:hypothetical protein
MNTTSAESGSSERFRRNSSRNLRFTRERTTELPTLVLTVTPKRRQPRSFGMINSTSDPETWRLPLS